MEYADRLERINQWVDSLHTAFNAVHDEINTLRDELREAEKKKPNITVVGADQPVDIGDIKNAQILSGDELAAVQELITHWAIKWPIGSGFADRIYELGKKIGWKDPTESVHDKVG